jgi:glycosyltransferase involved in cell wall biosynthesis
MLEPTSSVKLNHRIGIILGGSITTATRQAAESGDSPRIDVLEMQKRFGADLYDFQWFASRAKENWFVGLFYWLGKRFGLWSEFLAVSAFPALKTCDLIYATGEDVGLPTAVLFRVLRRKKPGIVMRIESPQYGKTSSKRFIYSQVYRFAAERIDEILCRTQAHINWIGSEYKLRRTRLTFLPESTDTGYFSPEREGSQISQVEFLKQPYIVSGGLEMRDFDTLIQAVQNLPVSVLICAGSPWAKVGHQISGALPANVFVRSFKREEMREVYRRAAFVVLPIKPTLRACGMNVILEAWGMGKGVIASQTEGLKSYIQHGHTGLFVPPGDVDALRSAICYLLETPEAAQRLGTCGQQTVRQEFCLERYLESAAAALLRAA